MLAVYAKFKDTPTDEIQPEEVRAVISAEVLENAASVEAGFKKYTTIDIELADSDAASIITYQKTVYALVDTVPDVVIFAKNIQEKILRGGNAQSEINLLNSIITKLLTIPVPTILSDLHLFLINSIYFIVQNLEIPPSSDDLVIYTQSLVAQKNINLVQQTLVDIATLASIYSQKN
jgi:hypothetical protein